MRFGIWEYFFSAEGVRPDPMKVKAINEIENPTNIKELQSFLGGINFINKLIPTFSEVTAPPKELLKKKNPWNWTITQEIAFTDIKKLVTNSPTLKILDLTKMSLFKLMLLNMDWDFA